MALRHRVFPAVPFSWVFLARYAPVPERSNRAMQKSLFLRSQRSRLLPKLLGPVSISGPVDFQLCLSWSAR